ncbi:MAG: T9SS type A sorting domain-containing protein [Bacteroidales bacterium]|nr:T9SS type A sorting domain-containing protein [Bacteroidales bacterium]
MKSLLTFILLFASLITYSQQISPEVIASGGDHFENNGVSLSWTIGEPVISTLESDYTLTQGFHQDFYIITAIDETEMENISVNIFPNPTKDFINIEWKSQTNEKVDIQLLDMNGRVLQEKSFNTSSDGMKINLNSFERSNYLLRITNGHQIKTYKIIKT